MYVTTQEDDIGFRRVRVQGLVFRVQGLGFRACGLTLLLGTTHGRLLGFGLPRKGCGTSNDLDTLKRCG